MGGKSSKSLNKSDLGSSQIDQYAQLLEQVDSALEKKRPTSRLVTEQWTPIQANLPAYALETLDENKVIVVRHSLSQDDPSANGKGSPRRKSSGSSDGGEALVYVFNPERVVSRRVSKRMSAMDESLLIERLSKSLDRHQSNLSNASAIPPASPQNTEKMFSMVNVGHPDKDVLKACDCCVIGRTGSAPIGISRALCQDEAHFDIKPDSVVFGVFDGHGPDGHLIAALCAKELESCVRDDQSFYFSQNDISEAVKGGIASLQRRLDEIPQNRADVEYSGATATIGYATKGGKVWLANVGDSRAIGARKEEGTNKYAVVQLSDEHIFSVPSEVDRIVNAGGKVSPVIIDGRPIGAPRCWFNYDEADAPGLMVSRTLGDSVARRIGVSSECSLYQAENLAFVILASDGLWEVMTNEDAIGFVAASILKHIPNMAISEMLCLEAKRRWFSLEGKCGDDICALILVF